MENKQIAQIRVVPAYPAKKKSFLSIIYFVLLATRLVVAIFFTVGPILYAMALAMLFMFFSAFQVKTVLELIFVVGAVGFAVVSVFGAMHLVCSAIKYSYNIAFKPAKA